MNQPSVSIIVPVYNVEPYVEDCIRSVMRQTYTGPMECIVVDDCGTDNSMAIVERLISEYDGPIKFKVFYHEHNRGLSAARNTGMDAATGEYLFFLDSDDEMTDDCIDELTKPLAKEYYDMIVGDASGYECNSSNQWVKNSFWEINISNDMTLRGSSKLSTFGSEWRWSAWSKLYRTDFLITSNLRFKEGLIYEDILWGFEIACLASSIYLLNKSTYKYRYREGSITHPLDYGIYIDALKLIVTEMGEFVANHGINMIDTYPIINDFYCDVLNHYKFSFSCYMNAYKQMRPHIIIKMKEILRANKYQKIKCLHDLHYKIPIFLAPVWQFYIYPRLYPYIAKIYKSI